MTSANWIAIAAENELAQTNKTLTELRKSCNV